MTHSIPAALVLLAGSAFAQSSGPAFEVASIKPAAPQTPGRMMIRMGGDPGRVNYSNVSIKDVIRQAYQVKDYQISGPDWLESQRFDINAKVPDGAPKEQIPQMLQNMLAERFKLSLHREKKELPAYAMVVAKGGPKLKESDPAAQPNFGPDGPPPPPPAAGRGGAPQFPPGARGMLMMRGPGHLAGKGLKMGAFSDMLSRFVDRPIVDETGLAGEYDFQLDWTPEPGEGGAFRFGPPGGDGPQQHAAGEGAPPAGAAPPELAAAPPLQVAIQQQMGLKLDAKKLPIEILVIDHAEKAPTEN